MNLEEFTYLQTNPQEIETKHTAELKELVVAFPYFQSARALYLKCLKNQRSFSYNNALKKTAAYTADRSILFDFITSEEFLQNKVSDYINSQNEESQRQQGSTEFQEKEDDISEDTSIDAQEHYKASQILDPDLFVAKEDSEMTRPSNSDPLQLGTPLPFTKSESHSFGEWLKLSAFQPIDRSSDSNDTKDTSSSPIAGQPEKKITKTIIAADNTLDEKSLEPKEVSTELSKKRKQKIVDSFIENNPKISRGTTAKNKKTVLTNTAQFSPDALMTETLARVYVEQKNYKKAKQAFRILSLKYPEKSGFFADQIRAVEQLEEH